MKTIWFAWAILLGGYSSFAQNTNTLLSKYLTVKNALVSGDSKAAAQAVAAFRQSVNEESQFYRKEPLLKATDRMVAASEIDKQRAAFAEVSTTLWEVIKDTDSVNQPVYYQYCPMKKAYWLSQEKEIKNPYYGSAMLTCGKLVETKK